MAGDGVGTWPPYLGRIGIDTPVHVQKTLGTRGPIPISGTLARAMIRRTISLTSLTLAACFALVAADEAKAVEQAERDWAKGITSQDYALLEKVLGDDLTYTHSTGARDTKKSYIDSMKSGAQKYVALDFVELNVHMLDKNSAYVISRAKVKSVTKGVSSEPTLSLLHVFARRQGRWQLVAHQSARLP